MKPIEEPVVIRTGPIDMQVCVPDDWTDEEVVKFAEAENPSGTAPPEGAGWCIRREGSELMDDCPERNPCSAREGFVHITLDA